MTIQDVLNEVDELKPNQYKSGTKISWISKIEKKIHDDIISRQGYDGPPPDYTRNTDLETVLLAPDAYADLYVYYVISMIEQHNGEIERYRNTSAMFNQLYINFIGWYYATHRQKR